MRAEPSTLIVALETIAPLASVTVPVILPVVATWAHRDRESKKNPANLLTIGNKRIPCEIKCTNGAHDSLGYGELQGSRRPSPDPWSSPYPRAPGVWQAVAGSLTFV